MSVTNTLCLTCLASATKGVPVPAPIAEFLHNVLCFQYARSNRLPNLICLSCYKTLSELKRFYMQLQDVEHYFTQKYVGETQINNEPPSTTKDPVKQNILTKIKRPKDLKPPSTGLESVNWVPLGEQFKTARENDMKTYKCHLCLKTFGLMSELTTHRSTHIRKKIICAELNHNRRWLNKHASTTHSQVHRNKADYKCDICWKKFYHPQEMRSHKLSHDKHAHML